jgi:4-amino-4-deoxy-L-arabinose transferase-like glycosyltransferase
MAPPRIVHVALVTGTASLAIVLWQSPVALLVWATDGFMAAATLAAATLAGLAVLPILGIRSLEPAWRVVVAAGLGIGLLSLAVLACGLCGLVGSERRLILPAVLLMAAFAGLRHRARGSTMVTFQSHSGLLRWMLVATAPFLSLTLLVATVPPGLLWQEEGGGYDVLEYHLQLPREYWEAGAIAYLPHNVYANLPQAAEMLYLFADMLHGDPIEAWSLAKCINALLGLLVVAAAWLAGRQLSPAGGIVTAAVTASVGWLIYLSGVAYVENGLLLFGMLSAACLVRAGRCDDRPQSWRWVLVAGLMAGTACGFKYTGVLMVALPLGAMALMLTRGPTGARLKAVGTFAGAAALTFSPWLVKNLALTGNPVFPLAGDVFRAYPEGWGEEESSHFAEVHAPAAQESRWTARMSLARRHIISDPAQRFGPLLFALATVALLRRRGRLEIALAITLGIQLAAWLLTTHLYARFAVPMLIPLVLLAGRGATADNGRVTWGFVVLILFGMSFNLYKAAELYAQHIYPQGERIDVEAKTGVFTEGLVGGWEHLQIINNRLDDNVRILMVGDARPFYWQRPVDYCVVFNRNPFAEAVARNENTEETLDWLRRQGYTHVFVHWDEIGRLRRSRYGFPAPITMPLFDQLQASGLVRTDVFKYPLSGRAYAELYEVPNEQP